MQRETLQKLHGAASLRQPACVAYAFSAAMVIAEGLAVTVENVGVRDGTSLAY